jgi:hypothetical protein
MSESITYWQNTNNNTFGEKPYGCSEEKDKQRSRKECKGTAITTHHTDNRYLNDHG